ncbi:MAG: hypothetical protein J07HX64_01465 [halophilic archaeon J07HX64]|jgi:Uncharacterized protein conserved in archaea|nr:MAG: hypothetical protein J07HX64_01465 [halophilic archaeon J07HX64]
MTTVTLIGARMAESGEEFVYQGESPDCEGCPYRKQCLNLTEGQRYRVTSVREGGNTLECAVHDTGVVAVEVEPVSVTANVPSNDAFAGNRASLAGPCPYTECPSHEYCEPAGVEFDETSRIDEVHGDPPHEYCMLDRELTLVEFEVPEDD